MTPAIGPTEGSPADASPAIPASAAPPSTTAPPTARPRHFSGALYLQVIVAIVAGVLVGYFYPATGAALKPLGDAFIKLVKMVIAPVIFLTVATGIAGMGELRSVGRVVGKAFVYFLFFSTLALGLGLVVANVVEPGVGLHIAPASLDSGAIASYTAKAHDTTVVGFLTNIIPTTMVSALTEGDILQVLFVAILTGVALVLVGDKGEPVLRVLNSATTLVFRIVSILM
ncbi:MAG: cation:dicarboxylate symporter family transporter, partial [Janthinobacterium lividum]